MKNPLKDSRYSVRIEYTGAFTPAPKGLKTGQRYVSRFCGDYIGFSETEKQAWEKCVAHNIDRFAPKFTAHRPPTQGEISRGYGATHYRDFTASQIGINAKGQLKSKFKAEDGLWYSLR
jgi:hypothetical protein